MTKRKIIFLSVGFVVFEALVWGVSYLLLSDSLFWVAGLVLTVCAITVLAVYILVSRIQRAPEQPVADSEPAAAPAPTNGNRDPDLNVLDAIFQEANQRLRNSRAEASVDKLPLYLLIGPEGCGKTSTFLGSRLEPKLLSGSVYRDMRVAPTRVCNLWYAAGAIFAEASGRFFAEDPSRWVRLLRHLKGKSAPSAFKSLWSSKTQNLRGCVLFLDAGQLVGMPDPGRVSTLSRSVQERLRLTAEVFGGDFPVYVVLSKSDQIPYFREYFHRLYEPETRQVLGFTVDAIPASDRQGRDVYADGESKRLSDAFNDVYYSLARHRTDMLARETDLDRKAGIYEFPREIKRVRGAVVQFLVDVFRPNALEPGPMLRGVYFTGTRKVPETTASGPSAQDSLIRSDATRLFRADELGRTAAVESQRENLAPQWLFVPKLFTDIVLADKIGTAAPVIDDRRTLTQRRLVFGGAIAACVLIAGLFAWSFWGNRSLVQTVEASVKGPGSSLEALEQLRQRVAELDAYEEKGRPWSLRWGLYSADNVLPELRQLYFERFREQLLDGVVTRLARSLSSLPPSQDPKYPYTLVYKQLKTYLTVVPRSCKPEQPAIGEMLSSAWASANNAGDADRALAETQFNYYAQELERDRVPFELTPDSFPIRNGRAYLSQSNPVDRILRSIVEEANQSPRKSAHLRDWAPRYREVLTGPDQVEAAFTKDGFEFIMGRIRSANPASMAQSCVLEGVERPTAVSGAQLAVQLNNKYIREYIDTWKRFIADARVKPYENHAGAARSLAILRDTDSPVLGLLFMVTDHTASMAQSGSGLAQTAAKEIATDASKTLLDRLSSKFGSSSQTVKNTALKAAGNIETPLAPTHIATVFQPAQAVFPTPLNRNRLIDPEKNGRYVSSLDALRGTFDSLAQVSNPRADAELNKQAAKAQADALATVQQMAYAFNRNTEGVDEAVRRLLEAPIRGSAGLFELDMTKAPREKLGGAAAQMCGKLRPLLHKFPFDPRTEEEVSMQELADFFAPQGGALWIFHQQHLANSIVKAGRHWILKGDAPDPKPSEEMITTFGRLATISDALFAPGSMQAGSRFVIKPLPAEGIQSITWNGEPLSFEGKTFPWPVPGVLLRIGMPGGAGVPFGNYPGPWAIFRLMADADPRPPGTHIFAVTNIRQGRSQPAPVEYNGKNITVRLQVVEFPGGVTSAFDKDFFSGISCPAKATE
jgi:type VI secretion system protein ImpL